MEPTVAWLRSRDLEVKREFQIPWGVCDLVGCSLNKTSVKRRLFSGRLSSVRSQLRVALLHSLPAVDEGKAASLEVMHESLGGVLDEARINLELKRLVDGNFVRITREGEYQKWSGWVPLHKRIVAVELKLTRISDVVQQAVSNLGFAQESYIGIPIEGAERLMTSNRWKGFKKKGIGMLGISADRCTVMHKASFVRDRPDAVLSAYCAERFWDVTIKDSST